MSIKVSAYIGTSLDGLIAKKDGGIDWLNEVGIEGTLLNS